MRHCFLAIMLAIGSMPVLSQSLGYKDILNKPEQASIHPDHKIAYGADPHQYGELWLPPANVKRPLPVVVLIHGGCWLADLPGPELVAFLADDLRKHGVAVWSLTYRRIGHPGGGYPGTFNDVADGVAYLRELEMKYHLDLTRVVAAGHSAGGHLALWAAAQKRIPRDSPLKREQLVRFKAVVGIAAIPDLAHYARVGRACGEGTVGQLVDTVKRTPVRAGTLNPAMPDQDVGAPYRDTSPAAMLPLEIDQILIQAAADRIVAPENGARYQALAKAKGDRVEVVTVEQAGHFELIAPWTAAGRTVVEVILRALK